MLRKTAHCMDQTDIWILTHQAGNLKTAYTEDKPLMDAVD